MMLSPGAHRCGRKDSSFVKREKGGAAKPSRSSHAPTEMTLLLIGGGG